MHINYSRCVNSAISMSACFWINAACQKLVHELFMSCKLQATLMMNFWLMQLFVVLVNPPIASVFRITYVASRGVNYPPAVSQVLCQLETRFQWFSFANFSVKPTPAASGTSSLVTTRWRTETGSSYKSVTGRDINVMSAATTEFSVMPDPLSQVPTSSDFGEKHQVQIGSRNSTPNRKH